MIWGPACLMTPLGSIHICGHRRARKASFVRGTSFELPYCRTKSRSREPPGPRPKRTEVQVGLAPLAPAPLVSTWTTSNPFDACVGESVPGPGGVRDRMRRVALRIARAAGVQTPVGDGRWEKVLGQRLRGHPATLVGCCGSAYTWRAEPFIVPASLFSPRSKQADGMVLVEAFTKASKSQVA